MKQVKTIKLEDHQIDGEFYTSFFLEQLTREEQEALKSDGSITIDKDRWDNH